MFCLPVYFCLTQDLESLQMGSLTKTYATDKSKESDGVWVDVAVNEDQSLARIKIRRMGQSNKAFTKRYAALNKRLRLMLGNKSELETKALREAFVETCVVAWENIENINEAFPGVEKEPYMLCTQENALKLFESLPELFDFIVGEAMSLETFQSEANEEEAKNSFPSSNTN